MNKVEHHEYTLRFLNEVEDIKEVTLLLVNDAQAIEVGKEMLKLNDLFMSVTILNSWNEIVKTVYKKGMRSLVDYMRGEVGTMGAAVKQLRMMSDEELGDIVYLMRKLIRHLDFNSGKHEIRLRGEYATNLIDNDTMVIFSKLFMEHPYSSSKEVAEMISIIDGEEGGVK